ncbi:hypothetical protein QP862_02745 [Lacticaseibacillus rhamnosus]|uniref:Uncharacterized protein n=1 Tax=Lacticaseibacillus rhamnosus LRHMDP3 TaxID=1203259 RepID=A0AB33XS11_LACRH|nr:hypothetical protein [Lacticaseibacillus rhamnosus]EKS49640.1 hypothetical protein LRHMDP3_2261 [Lacticaseibacillus rhamnosus LRHMDP3]EKS53286.1 hypothetical protein LRHMDP2_537 [Lacticaseibacillus rhamnosus LRHMDP2]MBS9526847.1 hypothetical protein [Lacticaseibacillus rhamnosus]MBS9787011.1 hypothetical protein [Lacticaseibacillus rhamnosus]MCH5390340.1 hypothetical protein [Lacticaseibacillus rhamnosus]
MKPSTTPLILLNLSMTVIVFSAILPAPWRIISCLFGVIATAICTRWYLGLAREE